MEVIGAVASIGQVIAISFSLSQNVATFLSDARNVVEAQGLLFDQVDTLHETVCAVRSQLIRQREVLKARVEVDAESRSLAQTERLLEKTSATGRILERTSITVEMLGDKLKKLGGGSDNPGWLRRGWRQIHMQVKLPEIVQIGRHIGLSISSLKVMLGCMTLDIQEESDARLAKIQQSMEELRALVQQILRETARPNRLNGEDVTDENMIASLAILDKEAADMASESLSVARSVYGSRPNSVRRFATRNEPHLPPSTITVSDDGLQTENGEGGVLLSGTFELPRPPPSIPTLRRASSGRIVPGVESSDLLTDYIDKNRAMALDAISQNDFDGAKAHILFAIEHAELREKTYEFLFEDRLQFLEIKAYVLTKNGDFSEAQEEYEELLRSTQMRSDDTGIRGRLCFALAQMYMEKYAKRKASERAEDILQACRDNGNVAYASAQEDPDRPDAKSLWGGHPSLRQAAELLYDMYKSWGRLAEAAVLFDRHLRNPEILIPRVPTRPQSYVELPPSPPTSTGLPDGDISTRNTDTIMTSYIPDIHTPIEKNDYKATEWCLSLPPSSLDIEKRNSRGLTPLLLAVSKGHTKIVRLLLEHERKPNVKAFSAKGWSVLHYALCGSMRDDMLDLLLCHGADVNAETKDGYKMRPLHLAVSNKNTHATRVLLKSGADTEVENSAERTPMELAVNKMEDDLVELLISESAILNRSKFDMDDHNVKSFFRRLENSDIIPRESKSPRKGSIASTGSSSSFAKRVFSRRPRNS